MNEFKIGDRVKVKARGEYGGKVINFMAAWPHVEEMSDTIGKEYTVQSGISICEDMGYVELSSGWIYNVLFLEHVEKKKIKLKKYTVTETHMEVI